jgi:uncharacterized protein
MTATTDTLLGRPLWYELMTSDMKAAESFYKTVVGWSTAPFDDAGQPYTMFKRSGDTSVGGLFTMPAEMKGVPPNWQMYVGVPKLEEAEAKIKGLGGKEVSPVISVPNVGRMRMMADPQGAHFCIYEPASPNQPPEAAPQVGDASWHELYTTDADAAMNFYRELFGWKATESMDMGPMGKYHMFGRSQGSMGGMMNKPKEMAQVPPHWLIYFHVNGIDAATERIKANGGKILNGPMEVPGGDWIVQAMDPQGAAFALHSKKK